MSKAPVGTGTTFDATVRAPWGRGKEFQVTISLTEFEQDRMLGVKMSRIGPAAPKATFTLAPADGGTRLTLEAHPNPQGFFKLLRPFMERRGAKAWSASLDRLKSILEAGGGESSTQGAGDST